MPSLNASAALDAVYPAKPAWVAEIRRDVTTAATGCGADELALLRISLAVSEAASNAILHAYREGAPSGDVHVLVRHAEDCLDVSVCDNGIGMSPRTDSPGMGLGLGLIAHETTTCEIRTTASGGTEVLMRFELGPLAG
jgi:anti-sigma regulatory factor (Ser/Thr protein kinase)